MKFKKIISGGRASEKFSLLKNVICKADIRDLSVGAFTLRKAAKD